jgi:hypothetical protein
MLVPTHNSSWLAELDKLLSAAVLAAIRALVAAAAAVVVDGVRHATYTEHNIHICCSQ